ncbi:hypothetical protein PPROV_000399700 [Pycnococcus provasolii]|uniref:protein-tyrosine-phosphatase n=1 Tax=Pycnococcus provasolii TaxID=41880 RepID=A0A830HDZ0_9CHLO|nr:hypothetical protein PPROV_000399700 [Pycnococcus provasolii]
MEEVGLVEEVVSMSSALSSSERANLHAETFLTTGTVDHDNLPDTAQVDVSAPASHSAHDFLWYARCRKCRQLLATNQHVVSHDVGKGFKQTKRGGANATSSGGEPECTSLYVEPMRWMDQEALADRAGVLLCPNPKCQTRLGDFDWAGSTCSCGAWVTPAFQIKMSKIDKMKKPTT